MYHVFVVNDRTFKYHLEYLFAGTCAPGSPDFLEQKEYRNTTKKGEGLTSKQELSICGMIADVSRIRKGDKIIFYLMQTSRHEGMFFGIFSVQNGAFFDSNTNNYLVADLGVYLNFRVRISPDKVYACGVTEREALDKLDGITHPSQMCWSLIYRKLKGKRGCTMITDQEAERLCNLIVTKNKGIPLIGNAFTYDQSLHSIKIDPQKKIYKGKTQSIDIKNRLLVKNQRKHAFEAHLQAYILQHILEHPIRDLLKICRKSNFWVGNEVSCGVGMQSIDIMTQQENRDCCVINIIEIKGTTPYKHILEDQLPKYIDWVKDYIAPLYNGKNVVIRPVIIAKRIENKAKLDDFINSCKQKIMPAIEGVNVEIVEYIGYSINMKGVSFSLLN